MFCLEPSCIMTLLENSYQPLQGHKYRNAWFLHYVRQENEKGAVLLRWGNCVHLWKYDFNSFNRNLKSIIESN